MDAQIRWPRDGHVKGRVAKVRSDEMIDKRGFCCRQPLNDDGKGKREKENVKRRVATGAGAVLARSAGE